MASMRWDRVATVGVPVAAGAMTAAVLLGPAEERPAVGVRVYGALAGGARVCAFRIEGVEYLEGVRRPEALRDLSVALRDAEGSALCEWRGGTDARGLTETQARTRRPLEAGESVGLEVTTGRSPSVLASAQVTVSAPAERLPPPTWSIPGPPAMTITLPRGHVVPELPETVLLAIVGPDGARPTLSLSTTGAEHEDTRPHKTGCDGPICRYVAEIAVVARAPTVRLAVDATLDGATSHWEGDLPIVPGGAWLDRTALTQGMLKVRSAVPQDELFVSKYDVTGRLWGAAIPMTTDDRGFSEGELVPPGGVDDGAILYRLASDPTEIPESTIGWPGLRMELLSGVPMRRLADGMPAAIAAEEARMERTRMPVFGLVIAAGLFEVLYLLRRYRRQGRALDEHLREELHAAPTGIRARTPVALLTFLSAILVLAFFILAAVAAWA